MSRASGDVFKRLIKENQLFFVLFLLFLIIAGSILGVIEQGDTIFFLVKIALPLAICFSPMRLGLARKLCI